MSALKFTVDRLNVEVHENRRELGKAAAAAVGARMKEEIARKGKVNVVFASAPSQNEFLEELKKDADIDWSKVVAFHMDVTSASPATPNRASPKPDDHLFNEVRPAEFHRIDGNSPDIEAECRAMPSFAEAGIDIVCLGIGENGHLPSTTRLWRTSGPEVGQGCGAWREVPPAAGERWSFPTLDEVPHRADHDHTGADVGQVGGVHGAGAS